MKNNYAKGKIILSLDKIIMPKKTVFTDESKIELDLFMNSDGNLFIQLRHSNDDAVFEKKHIVLDKEDAVDLLQKLKAIVNEME